MKKYILLLIFSLTLLSACSSSNKNIDFSKSEFALIDTKNFYLCSVDKTNDKVVVNYQLKPSKNKKNLGYLHWFNFENQDRYYLKTQTDKRQQTFLQTISKDDLSINSVKLENDYYSSYLYGEKLYTVSSGVNDTAYLTLDVYNSDLTLDYSNTFKYDTSAMLPGGLIVSDDIIYIVCGFISNNSEKSIYLLEFDLQFNLLEKTDLKVNNAGYQSAVKVDNILYLSKTMQGTDSTGLGIGSNYIDTYNLDTKVLTQNVIRLEQTHPERIEYDKLNNNLIIQHERWGAKNNYYSIYNLENNELTTLLFDKVEYGDSDFVFYEQNEENYYFQTPERLGIYNVKSKDLKEYDLKQLHLELSNGIFFTK